MTHKLLVDFVDANGIEKAAEIMEVTVRTVEGYFSGRSVPEQRLDKLRVMGHRQDLEYIKLRKDLDRLMFRWGNDERRVADALGVHPKDFKTGLTPKTLDLIRAILRPNDYVEHIRETLEMTVGDFAIFIGVSYDTVNRWKKGGVVPHTQIKILEKIANEHKIGF